MGRRSGGVRVGTKGAGVRTRTVGRRREEKRWGVENLELVGGVPWKPAIGDDEGVPTA